MAKSLAKAVMSRNVVRIELREVFNSTPGDGRHLKTISIVFTLRIGRCKSEKDRQDFFGIMGIHYGQVLHKEPEKLFRFKLKY